MNKTVFHETSGKTSNHADTRAFTTQRQDDSLEVEIVINSPHLIDLLKKACTNYPGSEYQALFKPRVCLKEPFMMLFYNMDTILKKKGLVEEGLKEVVDKLLDFKRIGFDPAAANRRPCASDAIAFHDLWHLYRPGTTVYKSSSEDDEIWSAFKIGKSSYRSLLEGADKEFRVVYYSLHFDESGKKLIPLLHELVLGSYIGERSSAGLELVPEVLMPNDQLRFVQDALEERGRKYWSFNGTATYQYYLGNAWNARHQQASNFEEVNVIIDYSTASRVVTHHLLEADRIMPLSDGCSCSACCQKYAALPAYPPSIVDNSATCPRDRYPNIRPSFVCGQNGRPTDPFMFCPSHIDAYALHHKSWMLVKIDALSDPKRTTTLLDCLVLAERTKFLLNTRIEELLDVQSSPQSDVAAFGSAVVLRGSPGTGKTMATRAIAKAKGRPLYILSWPDMIARKFEDFEQCVRKAFSDTENWSAFLVIDHADTLRSPSDNRVEVYSSFFLSKLENYCGVLFLLTGNETGDISKLMASRTSIMIQMNPLNVEARAKVWSNLAQSIGDSRIREALMNLTPQMLAYALNGHQIRNCLHTAITLAKRRDMTPQKKHLESALTYDAELTANGVPGELFELAKRAIGTSYSHRAGSTPSRAKLPRPTGYSSTTSSRVYHAEEQQTTYPFPIIPAATTPVASDSPSFDAPSLDTPSISVTVPPSPGLLPTLATSSTTVDANTLSPPRTQRPAIPATRPSAPSMLRRHTTQGSADQRASEVEPETVWTWKMLPARVRRPQLRFERGLSDGSEDERLSGRRDSGGGKGK